MTSPKSVKAVALTDITNATDLLRYAAKTQAIYLKTQHGIDFNELGAAMGLSKASFAGVLNDQSDKITNKLHDLDGAVFAFDPAFAARTGGLVALAARLRGYKDKSTAVGNLPAGWVSELLEKDFEKPIGFLMQASALLSAFMGAKSDRARSAVVAHHQLDLDKVVYPLLLIGAGAPAPHSIDALIVLGALARHPQAFEGVRGQHGTRDILRDVLADSPLGFRIWRAITSVVQAAANAGDPLTKDDPLPQWVQSRLVNDGDSLREKSLYPARSLDLELAIAIPSAWTIDRDWPTEILERRAADRSAHLRERGTAAMGIWERAVSHPDGIGSARVRRARMTLNVIIEALENEEQTASTRPYYSPPPGGRQWLSATLRHMLGQNEKVASTWPDDAEKYPFLRVVASGADRLRTDSTVPDPVRAATVFLFEQTLLQNAGVYRRKALNTLRGAGLATATAQAMITILEHADAEPWMRCRALFGIGFLQDRADRVQAALKDAFDHAREAVEHHVAKETLTRDVVSELHAVIFAIGDCYGALGQEPLARYMREKVDPELWPFVEHHQGPEFHPIARAAAYLLTVTPQLDGQKDDRVRLRHLEQTHPDPVTRQACAWALRMRFHDATTGNNAVRPLHLAPLNP
ncbi:hypothetical protein [Actinoplanes sp. NPDC051494]|uniref:hypothetical protein n=1 Tax=Actinoplanes sp. NPDC051494 TaxID=3363907 RepID=UPI0037B23CAC